MTRGSANDTPWWKAEGDDVHRKVFEYVENVEREQSALFERFRQMSFLYDPNDPSGSDSASVPTADASISQNVCASNVDAAYAAIAASEVRARFMTDEGDWSQQRQARHLEWYAGGLASLLDLHGHARAGFLDSAKKGTGLVKVYADSTLDYGICVERVLVDDVIVDNRECRAGAKPKQLHQRLIVDKDELCYRYPDHEEEIERAARSGGYGPRHWAGYRDYDSNELVALESWRLGSPGRHTLTIDGHTILDEEWTSTCFPFARIVWSERTTGWYGIGLIERIAPTQRVINRYNWLEEAWIRRHAIPTTWVRPSDATTTVKAQGVLGNMGIYKGDLPVTVWPQAVSPEVASRRREAVESAYEETGISRLAATSRKPPGLESGVALREYRDQTTQRFAQQEKAFERFYLDLVQLAIGCAKELGDDAPVISHRGARSYKRIKWSKVDMGDVRVQIQAASDLPRTPAGRQQLAIELAQAGVISKDSALETMTDLDITAELSLYKAAQENIDRALDDIIDGEDGIVPEAYDNLELAKWRSQQRYLKERADGCPEPVLEGIRQYNTQAVSMLTMAAGPAAAEAPMPADPAMPGVPPEMAAPPGAPPVAALAPQAMDLVAG